MLPPVNENCERESNPMPQPLYLYLSGSAFLVSFTDPDKQLPKVKPVFKSLGHRSSVQQIYEFIAPEEGSLLLFIKQ